MNAGRRIGCLLSLIDLIQVLDQKKLHADKNRASRLFVLIVCLAIRTNHTLLRIQTPRRKLPNAGFPVSDEMLMYGKGNQWLWRGRDTHRLCYFS